MSDRRNRSRLDQQRRNQQREDDDEEVEVVRRQVHMEEKINPVAVATIAAVAVGIGGYLYSKFFSSTKPANTRYVTTSEQCKEVLQRLREDLEEMPVLGLDCQWTTSHDNERNRIALVQLATFKGKFILIAMNKLESIPYELREILRDREIVKAGIEGIKDARYLHQDYNLEVNSTFDLRYLAQDTANQPVGLEGLSRNIIGVDLGRDWELMASNWDQEPLTAQQLNYAEQAVKASIDIFKTLIGFVQLGSSTRDIINYCRPHFDIAYTYHASSKY